MSARPTVWVLGDQLRDDVGPLSTRTPRDATVLMIESRARAAALPYHKHKLIFSWSAMRDHAARLRKRGYTVDYHETSSSYADALAAHVKQHEPSSVVLMETAEYGRADGLAEKARKLGVHAEVEPNAMFLSDRQAFADWAGGRKTLRMEDFYRTMRVKTGLLMDGSEPEDGKWNLDHENRKRAPKGHVFPQPAKLRSTKTVAAVRDIVAGEFPDHMGEAATFRLPTGKAGAAKFLDDFIENRLDLFGPYQDAIVRGERLMYHSTLSALINVGLIDPLEACRRAEAEYREGRARLQSVEGFIRQIIGWREFLYQVYHLRMPGYLESNALNADLPLPAFYWDAQTDLACIGDAVQAVVDNGFNHHIQRLMITGNFALIAGLSPQEVNRWYWLAYVDAYEWVVSPNVLGMALYADGGVFATKPYAASAAYVNRMSDCCRGCRYDPKQRTGDDACPFNALYWDFLDRNSKRLRPNHRMKMVYANLDKLDGAERKRVRSHAKDLRERLASGDRL